MRSDDRPIIVLIEVWNRFLEEGITGPAAIVSGHVFIVGLTLDCFKGAEKDGSAKGIFQEAQGPASEYALHSDRLQLMSRIMPHGLVFALEDIRSTEADLQSIEWSSDDGLDATGEEACSHSDGRRRRGEDALGLVRGGLMQGRQSVEIARVEDCANAREESVCV